MTILSTEPRTAAVHRVDGIHKSPATVAALKALVHDVPNAVHTEHRGDRPSSDLITRFIQSFTELEGYRYVTGIDRHDVDPTPTILLQRLLVPNVSCLPPEMAR